MAVKVLKQKNGHKLEAEEYGENSTLNRYWVGSKRYDSYEKADKAYQKLL